MAVSKNKVTADVTTGTGILAFPKIFPDTAGKRDDGKPDYNIQILIPKSDKKTIKELVAAIRKVGEGTWGDKWTSPSIKNPLRDGDKEKDNLTEDGSTAGEKYPERLGHYFINARSTKPVGVVDQHRDLIVDSSKVYGGCKGRVSINFYPYTGTSVGIAAGLNGVQFVADGEPFGNGGKPSIESMFDEISEEDEFNLNEIDDEPKKSKKDKGKKSKDEKPKDEKPKGKKSKKS